MYVHTVCATSIDKRNTNTNERWFHCKDTSYSVNAHNFTLLKTFGACLFAQITITTCPNLTKRIT